MGKSICLRSNRQQRKALQTEKKQKNMNALRRTTKLKNMIQSKELEFIMEAHNGLSAAIVQEAGFKGIWGSGLSISAQFGVRDSNEASWTQVLDNLEFMADRSPNIPILLDGDTGYGNFNNARRLIKKLEQRGVAGVCLEDKIFPKRNSLLDEGSGKQELADIKEFSKKITACKDTQTDPDFQVVARVEAFIAGWGLDAALERSLAYKEAGADAILMHSKRKDPKEIEAFMKAWNNQLPVIIVPTNYYTTPTDQFRDWGVSMVIWANHNMRSAVGAMQQVTNQIYKDQSLVNVENNIVPVKEVFRIQDEPELKDAESKYL
ncbi:Pyruvate/Phosphoenolpyruvate kinase-like domain [Pseudocohnilembus persalinus]|uniref:phosphoenolpyruvate mutase n=1 Tax=Pseudocohnilembus persalinus TaxID=266149 RepID=A0A0V0QGY7_PSEPJ|nr:Pyruvate/Phosphoenolpyruvate kinase-like domain [Pseudocohnilembus persalinus]|eukprot:KRX01412.1 Pyruvate/Phosphoenolpyruvate kinase-like domain [Pseudocohnilembus persalinus]